MQNALFSHSNGVVEENTYNKVGNLVVRVQKKDEEVIERTEYTYDAAGNITAVSESSTAAEDKSVLKNAVMTYDADNRLLTYNGEKIRYDADGNMTYGPLNGVMTEFTYDSRNRLIKSGETTYEYDAENNRIAVETENYRDEYTLDVESTYSQMLVAERTYKDGKVEVSRYVYGNGLIGEEKTTGEETEYAIYLYNHLGSTTAVTDESGIVIETYDYGAYGELLTENIGTRRFLYNGQLGVVTDDNGLYHMRARYYNTDIKRFISRDIVVGDITNSQSLNRYCYVQGNPLSYVDPFGLSPLSILCEIGHGILTVLGFVPKYGFLFDLINAGWYAAEKKKFEAICCGVSALPGLGDGVAALVQVGKYGGKALKSSLLIKGISHLMGDIGSLCISGVTMAESAENLLKAYRGEAYEGTILGNSLLCCLSLVSGILSGTGILKNVNSLRKLDDTIPAIGSKVAKDIVEESSAPIGKSGSNSAYKLGNNIPTSQSLTRQDIINSLDGVTDSSTLIANAIQDGKIKINVLGDELFESYLGASSDITAMQVGNQIYMRRSSASIYSDVVHEGTHAMDFINNIPQREISSWAGEIRAYSAERLFQIESGMPVQFATENDMLMHIWSNYKR